jgi:protein-tyrosine phosphatase
MQAMETLPMSEDDDLERLAAAPGRLEPLERGSNFRDLGGYRGAGGRPVRWRRIFRAGASPLLTDADLARLAALDLRHVIDLRSTQERALAPSRLPGAGIAYWAHDYDAATIFAHLLEPGDALASRSLYRDWPHTLAPQFQRLFETLLRAQGAVLFTCSAGQDRTGCAAALVLGALGVDRAQIVADYHLSTRWRRPEVEFPPFDPADHPDNLVAQFFGRVRALPHPPQPAPLVRDDGSPRLADLFEEIEAHWGAFDDYLTDALGLSPADISALQAAYLEG